MLITRNQRYLKPHPGNVEVKFKSNPPSNTLISSSPNVCNVQKPISNKVPDADKVSTEKRVSAKINKSPEDQSSSNPTYVMKSGGVVKKPACFLDK